jgi:hypothetical protein
MTRRATAYAVLAAGIVSGVVFTAAAAVAEWTVPGKSVRVTAAAASLAAPGKPTATLKRGTVNLSWPGVDLGPGNKGGYRVFRHGPSGQPKPAGGSCAGVVRDNRCSDAGTPPGTWRYTVRAVYGPKWIGPHSPKSAPVHTGGYEAPRLMEQPAAEEQTVEPTPTATATAEPEPEPKPSEPSEPEPTASTTTVTPEASPT